MPFPSPTHESESEVVQSCPTLSDSMDCSLPGSSVGGIFQARVLEWGAIAFSGILYIENPIFVCHLQTVTVLFFPLQFEILFLFLGDGLDSYWRIPGTGEPGGLPSMGSHRVGHD